MTKSEDALAKHLIRMSDPNIPGYTDHVFMALDFSSWCSGFRVESVGSLFEELERLFGINHVFAYTQHFPLEATLLFQHRFNPPRQGADGLLQEGPR